MSDFYVAIFEQNNEGEFFVTVPDLPGVNAAAKTRADAVKLAIEFANDYARDLVGDGHPVPAARDIDAIEHDPDVKEVGRVMIPVEVPGKSVKISLSIDEALLKRADRAAEEEGLTRSAYIAAALDTRLRMQRPAITELRDGIYHMGGGAWTPTIVRGIRHDGPMRNVTVHGGGDIFGFSDSLANLAGDRDVHIHIGKRMTGRDARTGIVKGEPRKEK